MINASDLFHLSYYEKAAFTGSCDGMRFRIEKSPGSEDGAPDQFTAWTYPGPFNFEHTPDGQKQSQGFPFAEESLADIADWLNEQYAKRQDFWHVHTQLI